VCIVLRSGLNTKMFPETFTDDSRTITQSGVFLNTNKSSNGIIQIIYYDNNLVSCSQNTKNFDKLKEMVAKVYPKPKSYYFF